MNSINLLHSMSHNKFVTLDFYFVRHYCIAPGKNYFYIGERQVLNMLYSQINKFNN